MADLSAPALATAASALAALHHRPAVSWLYGYVLAAYRRLDAFSGRQLAAVFDALPTISPHPAWLDEV
jgi:hypothetical protein